MVTDECGVHTLLFKELTNKLVKEASSGLLMTTSSKDNTDSVWNMIRPRSTDQRYHVLLVFITAAQMPHLALHHNTTFTTSPAAYLWCWAVDIVLDDQFLQLLAALLSFQRLRELLTQSSF